MEHSTLNILPKMRQSRIRTLTGHNEEGVYRKVYPYIIVSFAGYIYLKMTALSVSRIAK